MNNSISINPAQPIQHLLDDPEVLEILIDNHDTIYVEKGGQLHDIASPFADDQQLLTMIGAMAAAMGVSINESNPVVDIRLPDGSRMNIVLPPIALGGPSLVIRKFSSRLLTIEDLIGFGSLTQPEVDFLQACVLGRANILVSGGTGSGKTTVLNVLTDFIPKEERVITVENAAELRPRTNPRRTVRLESRPANLEGRGEVSMSDLLVNALRMRPDRILLGEARGGEVLHFLQALNTGHDGSMFTMHATTPRDALNRLETMIVMANPSVPLLNVRQQMASGLDIIVQANRLADGSRKLVQIAEVVGMQGDTILLQDIFKFQQAGTKDGRITGQSSPTGNIPTILNQLSKQNIDLPVSLFTPNLNS